MSLESARCLETALAFCSGLSELPFFSPPDGAYNRADHREGCLLVRIGSSYGFHLRYDDCNIDYTQGWATLT